MNKKLAVLSYTFIALLTFAKSIGLSSSDKVYVIIFTAGTILCIAKILNEKYTKREMLILGSLFIIALACFLIGKETTLLFTALVLISLKGVNISKAIKMMFWIKLITLLMIVIMTVSGLINDNTLEMWRNEETIIRHSLVYGHPNTLHLNFAIIAFLWIFAYYDKLNIMSVAIIEVINYLVYLQTYSRTGFILTAIFVLFSLMYRYNSKVRMIIMNNTTKVFLLVLLLTLLTGLLYKKTNILGSIDRLLTGRLYYNNYFLTHVFPPIVGKAEYEGLMIDNGYISLLYNGGILCFVWFLYVMKKMGQTVKNKRLEKEALLLLTFEFYSLTESFYMNTIMNVSLLFVTYFIFSIPEKNLKKGLACKSQS